MPPWNGSNIPPRTAAWTHSVEEPSFFEPEAPLGVWVPNSSLTFNDRAFGVCGPVIWNSLDCDIRNCDKINDFKTKLKTFYFRKAFTVWIFYYLFISVLFITTVILSTFISAFRARFVNFTHYKINLLLYLYPSAWIKRAITVQYYSLQQAKSMLFSFKEGWHVVQPSADSKVNIWLKIECSGGSRISG